MTVLEVGPRSVRVLSGPGGPVEPALAEAAVEWIDDPVGLYGERPVAVAELWRAVMTAAVAAQSGPVVLVHPDGWSRHRIARVVAAANTVADEVAAVPSSQWRRDGPPPAPDVAADIGHRQPPPRRRRSVALWGPALGLAVLLAGTALVGRSTPPAESGPPGDTTAVVEGRVEVRVPQSWAVVRVTSGPGSHRLQAGPPADPDIAVHITQAYAPESTLAQAAAVLSKAIAGQPAGVFADLRADGQAAGRPAVTYREVRPGRVVDWSVLQVGATRIGIGCQSPPDRPAAVRDACRAALASVRESGTDSPR